MNNDHTFYKSFSGTDAMAYMLLPNVKPILMGSLTTVSYSTHRDKKPVSVIGSIQVKGFTRGLRIVAGTMIFTLINQQFVKDLIEQVPYLAEHGTVKADELPIFDIMIICANEHGYVSKMMIYGIDFTDEGQVVSIEDVFTENTFSFVARDFDGFTRSQSVISGKRNTINTIQNYSFSEDGYMQLTEYQKSLSENTKLIEIQSKLVLVGMLKKATGIYDDDTIDVIAKIQKDSKLNPTGKLDDLTYNKIKSLDGSKKLVVSNNKYGTPIYSDSKYTDTISNIEYGESILVEESDEDLYKVNLGGIVGYIKKDDVIKFNDIYVLVRFESSYVFDFKKTYANEINAVFKSNKDIYVKLATISYFKNNHTYNNERVVLVNKDTDFTISLNSLPEAFLYNDKENAFPYKIEMFYVGAGFDPFKINVEVKS